jgi:NAD(P)-dependent dehydrogenase (short-subunit alcohol dehydrogenase family)
MDGLLTGKSVVITGAGSGVGRCAVQLFAEHGARVLALDINLETAEASVELARHAGQDAFARVCDVSDPAMVTAAVDAAVERFGRLDVMYNNAGVTTKLKAGGGSSSFMDTTHEELMRLTEINVGGVVNGSRAAIRAFQRQGGGGVIVNTASIAGLIGYGGPIYSATKGAVTTLTRSLALQYAGEGIRVNSVCPSAMMTNFAASAGPIPQEVIDWSARLHPLGRNTDPMDCAKAALFLASDLAAQITGVNLPVDGGISAGVKV